MKINRRVTKIKIKKDKIFISYQESNSGRGSEWDEYSLRCCDQARPELYETMKKLDAQVCDICELPKDYEKRITTTGVTFIYNDETGAWGIVLTAQMDLNSNPAPLNLNTPYKSNTGNDGQEDYALSDTCAIILAKLSEECFLYINGDRAQGKLFDVDAEYVKDDTKRIENRDVLQLGSFQQ
ncbi:hypothetical protein [Pectinatus frisingensis]|uniref:hypothetical protein n=1 Tax=Pectinatus frisingensis TaxID=865 RepID=UPI0018C4F65C|nr:hypothetical protein [Pectinatus frisingensis]